MRPVAPLDQLFLRLEGRNQPMHVGGLILLRPPEDAGEGYVAGIVERLRAVNVAEPPFDQKLVRKRGNWFWEKDAEFDIEAHIWHLALPRPGRIRELLALVSQLHGNLLDREKPLWEAYVIDGVEGGRVALYCKIHHAVADGVATMRMLERAMSEDASAREVVPLWAMPPRARGAEPSPPARLDATTAVAQAASVAKERLGIVPTVAREVTRSLRARGREPDHVSVTQAPRSLLNRRVSASRRFAAQSFPLSRVQEVGKRAGATVNDVVLAMTSSALRRYLAELGALPERPLVAMVPVSLRKDESDSGNQVALVLANLATTLENPEERLAAIARSVRHGKMRFARMSQAEIMAYLSATLAANGLNIATGLLPERQAWNVVVSNVPGPKRPLYFCGARVEGIYPVSIVLDGQALNVTVSSYAGSLEFGLVACRRTLPHMQKLLFYLEEALAELEAGLEAAPS